MAEVAEAVRRILQGSPMPGVLKSGSRMKSVEAQIRCVCVCVSVCVCVCGGVDASNRHPKGFKVSSKPSGAAGNSLSSMHAQARKAGETVESVLQH